MAKEITPKEAAIKMEVLAKLKLGGKPSDLVEEFSLPYSKILKWKRELAEAQEAEVIERLVDVDKILVHEVAEAVAEELQQLEDAPEAIAGEVQKAVKGIDSLQTLNTQVQLTATKLVEKINAEASFVEGARDLGLLVAALTQIQNAFFNKQSMTFNMLHQSGVEGDGVSAFKALLRD